MPGLGYRRIAIAGQLVLILFGIAWAVLERPAPVITVRWRDGLSLQARAQAAQQLQLQHEQPSDDAWQYEALDPRAPAVAAIIAHPDVLDTSHIDRGSATLAADAGRGEARVWWAGPFHGPRGSEQFRLLLTAVALVTVACGLLGRRK
jgi:hypothetical protein